MDDLNGDGFGDVVVGAPEERAGTPSVGSAGNCYVFSGHDGTLIRRFSSPTPVAFGAFGQAVTNLGDINQDGAGDFAVGEWGVGNVYLYSGADGSVLRTLSAPPGGGGSFGFSIASLQVPDTGEVTRLAVGAFSAFGGEGRVHVFSIASGELIYTIRSPTPYHAGLFGHGVKAVPDLDRDNQPDLVASPTGETTPSGARGYGILHVFSGATGVWLYTIYSPSYPINDFARTYAGIPDIDGDGNGDIVIGARTQNAVGNPSLSGLAYVYSGATGQLRQVLASPRPTLEGLYGFGIGGFASLNGTNYGNFIISAKETPIGLPRDAGIAYMYQGDTYSLYRTFVSPRPRPQSYGWFGGDAKLIPDTNGDGRPDLLFFAADGCVSCPVPQRGYIFHSCAADMNYDGYLNSQDFFDYISVFFGQPTTLNPDFNRDGAVNSMDFFDFLKAFFAGCP